MQNVLKCSDALEKPCRKKSLERWCLKRIQIMERIFKPKLCYHYG